MYEKITIENAIEWFDIIKYVACGFILVYPIIYAFTPGYHYLESVKNYSLIKAVTISAIFLLFPVVVVLLLINIL